MGPASEWVKSCSPLAMEDNKFPTSLVLIKNLTHPLFLEKRERTSARGESLGKEGVASLSESCRRFTSMLFRTLTFRHTPTQSRHLDVESSKRVKWVNNVRLSLCGLVREVCLDYCSDPTASDYDPERNPVASVFVTSREKVLCFPGDP